MMVVLNGVVINNVLNFLVNFVFEVYNGFILGYFSGVLDIKFMLFVFNNNFELFKEMVFL